MENELDPIKLEIFRLAQNIVNGEYADVRACAHNRWVADSATLWQRSRQRLAYPDFPPYPTEEVIIARAEIMLNFLYLRESVELEEKKAEIEPLPALTPNEPYVILEASEADNTRPPRSKLDKMVDRIRQSF